MGEREAVVGRSAQHAVHVLPHAPFAMARILEPALDRLTEEAEGTQLLVITPDADTAVAIADAARALDSRTGTPVVAITAASRGTRLLSSRALPAIAATPGTLVALLRNSAAKLETVRSVIIAWADELYDAREGEALEVVLAEIPKDASRIVVADRVSPEVDALVERHLRRASRPGASEPDAEPASLPIRYVTTTESTRTSVFRRLLDDLDPPSVIVIASDSAALEEARDAVGSFGFEGDASIRVEGEPIEEQAALVVFYDLPLAASHVAKVAATTPAQVVALVTPRQVPALRRLTSGPVEPLDISRAAVKARARDERLRAALRTELSAGFPARELMALEPLLAEFDGIEIAAAALRLMERERADARARPAEPERTAAAPQREARSEEPRSAEARGADTRGERRPTRSSDRAASPRPGAFARVFLSIGERDGVRPGDLVGAITGESGITSDRIGKIEIRDGHTVAEIAPADAETVIEKMNGLTIKGRRITARVDDRPARERSFGDRDRGPRRSGPGGAYRSGPREGGRAPREGGRPPREGGRPPREGGRGPRDGARPPREGGRSFADRRPRRDDDRPRGRGAFRDRPDEGRVPRAARERDEWTERADRVRNARRPRRDEP